MAWRAKYTPKKKTITVREVVDFMHGCKRCVWRKFNIGASPPLILSPVFTTFDSDPTRPHQVAHTAFTDPGCPPGTPTRASVELRALALWT